MEIEHKQADRQTRLYIKIKIKIKMSSLKLRQLLSMKVNKNFISVYANYNVIIVCE